jgi:lipopolysaccharide heptosyltransferase II
MPLTPFSTLPARLSLVALKFFALVAYKNQRRGFAGQAHDRSVSRILVLELWNIGDVILAMPFLARLRSLFPGAKVTLLSKLFAADLLSGTELVDEFIVADFAWTPGDRVQPLKKTIDLWRLSREMRRKKFDVAFSSRLHRREHVLLALSGATRRVGFALGKRDASLTDAIVVGDAQRHRVDDWMRLLEPFGVASPGRVPRLHVEESERLWAKGYLDSRGVLKGDLLVGIHPGASLAEKRWPLDRFSDVATATAAQSGVRVLGFAEPSGYGSELFAIPGVVGAQVGLRELMALIERCDLLICNDSGPMHIAGALGVPTVAMFGSGIDQWFAPLGEGHETLTPDKDASCLDLPSPGNSIRTPMGIETPQVLDAVGRAVQRLRGGDTFSRV